MTLTIRNASGLYEAARDVTELLGNGTDACSVERRLRAVLDDRDRSLSQLARLANALRRLETFSRAFGEVDLTAEVTR